MRWPLLPAAWLPAFLLMSTPVIAGEAGSPVVIAHRGASGYLPEHTLESKAYAHALGADYLEQDVVLTHDGVPIVLHDIWLDGVTDVAEVFPERHREDGRFYAIDFTLEEIRRLTVHERRDRAGRQRWPSRFNAPGMRFRIPTLAEEVAFVRAVNRATGREAGIYPEVKEPAWHRAQGRDPSRAILEVLDAAGYSGREDRIFLQCFDAAELRRIREELGSRLRLVLLLGDEDWLGTPRAEGNLSDIAGYADGIGAWIPTLFAAPAVGAEPARSGLVAAAHAHGLFVHAYTYRNDQLPEGVAGPAEAHRLLYGIARIDGLFSDHPDVSLRFRPTAQVAAGPALK